MTISSQILQQPTKLIQAIEKEKKMWRRQAREEQLPPAGDWFVWMIRAGRGWGKTRTAAEWFHMRAKEKAKRWMALISKTPGDARDDCIEGPGGIIQNGDPDFPAEYEPSKRRITWPNGSYATIYSGANPEQVRGFSGDTAWCDEMAAWDFPRVTWDNLMYGMREGDDPRLVISTTPKPLDILQEIEDKKSTVVIQGSSYENRSNLSDRFFETVIEPAEGTTLGRQEIHAEYIQSAGIWTWEMIESAKKGWPDKLPHFDEICVSIDPAVTNNADSDETGIIVMGRKENNFYVIEDLTLKGSPNTWAMAAINAYKRYEADCIVGETNQGGDMVETVISNLDRNIPFRDVRATRGKTRRAQPTVAAYERNEIYHNAGLEQLEKQLVGYTGNDTKESPDRMDALVWAHYYLSEDDEGGESRGRFSVWAGA